MKRKFLTNLTLLIILNLLIKPFWVFGIDLTVQNTVGANEYGFYFSLLSFSMLLNIIQDMGIASFNNRAIARNHGLLSRLMPNILILKLMLLLAYFIVSLTVAYFIGYKWMQVKLLLVLLFNQSLNTLNLYLRSNIGGLQLFRTDSIVSVTDRFLMIIICSVLLWGNVTGSEFRIEWFVYAQTAAYFITTLIILLILSRHVDAVNFRLDLSVTRNMLIKSYPYALLGLMMVLYYRTDSVMLERMLPDGKLQAGIYAQGFRILDAASMLGFLFAGILLPMFAKMIKQKEPVEQLFRFSFMLLIIPAVTGAVALNWFKFEIMDLLYREHAAESSGVFGYLMVSFVFVSSSIITGSLLTANGNIRYLNLIAGFSVLLNIGLNLILIPRLQAQGSALASMVTQSFTAALQLVLVMRIFALSPSVKFIARFAVFITVLVLAGYLARMFVPGPLAGFLVTAAIGPPAALLLKLISLREITGALF
ncbi:MAG: hypothetical protein EA408_13590 [Marinilabiliales bacterium]|nr:MAG: hypothetical protein EA408_13590 [Marinilabiliales bacterium]